MYLSGGPGGAGSFEATSMIEQGLNADREVIFVDQRGTHHADPLLGCPELDEFFNDAISVPFTAESTTAGQAAAVKECRDRLAATGVDLSAYDTAENSADIADLRVALGIDSDASGVPKMIDDMARGDAGSTVAAMLALQTPPVIVGLGGFGLALGVFCSENADLTTEDAALAKARSALPQFPDPVLRIQPKQGRMFTDCPVWDVGKADATAKAPTVSDLPVLIMEGDVDAATAPGWVDLITPTLGSSQLVEFPFTGHAVLPKSACALSTMTAFLDNPTQPVDRTCAAQTTLTFTTG